jgi:hypothetical protein
MRTGSARFFAVQDALVKGKFPVARLAIFGFAFTLGGAIIAVFAVLLGTGATA